MISLNQVFRAIGNEIERRSNSDRRSFDLATQFPVINCNGKLIKQDRRSRPDRRIANIQVKGHFLHAKKDLLKKFIEI